MSVVQPPPKATIVPSRPSRSSRQSRSTAPRLLASSPPRSAWTGASSGGRCSPSTVASATTSSSPSTSSGSRASSPSSTSMPAAASTMSSTSLATACGDLLVERRASLVQRVERCSSCASGRSPPPTRVQAVAGRPRRARSNACSRSAWRICSVSTAPPPSATTAAVRWPASRASPRPRARGTRPRRARQRPAGSSAPASARARGRGRRTAGPASRQPARRGSTCPRP